MKPGFSLMELLVGIVLFGVVMASANVFLATSLRGARKASAVGMAKSEGAYVMSAMGQVVKYAESINCTGTNTLNVVRANGDVLNYIFDTATTPARIASVSAAGTTGLTSGKVRVTACGGGVFNCAAARNFVTVCFSVENAATTDITNQAGTTGVKFESQMTLRNWGQ